MSTYEFWYEDTRLFECYLKAHHDKINETAWFNGLYTFEAVSVAINNVMPGAIGRGISGKQGKTLSYHEKPIESNKKPKEEKSEAEDYALNRWVHKFRRLKGGKDNA